MGGISPEDDFPQDFCDALRSRDYVLAAITELETATTTELYTMMKGGIADGVSQAATGS